MSLVGKIAVTAGTAEARIRGVVAEDVGHGVMLEPRPTKDAGQFLPTTTKPDTVAFFATKEEAEAAVERYSAEWHRHTDLIMEAEAAYLRAIELRGAMSRAVMREPESAA